MLSVNKPSTQYRPDDIIALCKYSLKKDDSGVAKEDKTTCTESGCTGRAVAFDFIKSGMIDKINAILIKEMEANIEDTNKVLELYLNFKSMREYRKDIESNSKKRNLPTLIDTFYSQNVIPYLYRVSFNFDDNIERCVTKFIVAIDGYKKMLNYIVHPMTASTDNGTLKLYNSQNTSTVHTKLKRYILQGTNTYKYLLQQLICIKAYVYQGNNPFNQKRPAMSLTADLLSHFVSPDLFIVARETILPTIGIIARDAGHTKCSAISIIKLTSVIKQCVTDGLFYPKFLNSSKGEKFFEMFMDAMGFISDSVNKTKNGKAAYVAVHLTQELITLWTTRGEMSEEYKAISEKMVQFDDITTQMACELYHGDQETFHADEICQHPEVKIERPNYYNPEKQDQLRYGILFSTAPLLLNSRAFKTYYGIKDSKKLKRVLGSNGDSSNYFSIESGKSLDDCTIKIILGDIDEIVDKPFDALVRCNPENFEEIQLNEKLLYEILRPENKGKYNKILLPEYQKLYEVPMIANLKFLKKDYILGNLVSKSYYDTLADVECTIESNKLRILHKINLKKTLYEAGGVEIPKCTVFIVGDEHLHTQALGQDPYSSLLLPNNVVVMEQGNDTSLFALNPMILNDIEDLEISMTIIEKLKNRIENIVHLRQGPCDNFFEINDQLGVSSYHSAKQKSYAMTKTYSGVDIGKVLDKVLFVSKASKFGKELTQLGLFKLREQHKSADSDSDKQVFVPLIGKLETIAKDLKHDPSVLALWPYRMSVNSVNGEGVSVSAINPSAIIEATGDQTFTSFGDDMSKKLFSTIQDVQSELA